MSWSLKSSVLRRGRRSGAELLEDHVLVELPGISEMLLNSRHPLHGIAVDADQCIEKQRWAIPTSKDPQEVFKAKLRQHATDVRVLDNIKANGGIHFARIRKLLQLQQGGKRGLLSLTEMNLFPVPTADDTILLVEITWEAGAWIFHVCFQGDEFVDFPPCRAGSWVFYPKLPASLANGTAE